MVRLSFDSNFKLQYQVLAQYLFRQGPFTPETLKVLDRIAGVCLREIYKASHSGHSDFARQSWNAQHIDSDFRLLQLAFQSLGKKAAHPTVRQSWDLPTFYRHLRAKKLKKCRLELWATLAPEVGFQLPENIKSLSSEEVELKFNAWLKERNGLPLLTRLCIDRSSQRPSPIPPEIGQLQSLKKLHVKYASGEEGLRSLPPEVCQLKSLKTLKITPHSFKIFPPVIFQLPALKKLYFRGSSRSFTTLPRQISQLKTLEELVLYGPIQTLPYEICQLPSLWKLKIDTVLLAASPLEIQQFWQSLIVESFRRGLNGG